jgi:hypothetical protein
MGALVALLSLLGSLVAAEDALPETTVVISIAEQKLVILRDGGWWKKYPVSTSKFGVGDNFGSYKTPLGRLRISEKIGNDLAAGAVLKQRHATGEVLPANSPGRDPIVTRILWLDGLEEQNRNARSRGIYIHGTTEESKIGQPVSYGCIRMRSHDVLEVFDELPLDTPVSIIAEKLPKLPKYTPPKPQIIASGPPPKQKAAAPTPAPAVASTAPAKKPASSAPVEQTPPVTAAPAERPSNPLANHAMMGSMLDAGLPQGPKIPTLPPPPEPKDVPRFSAWASEPVKESAFSLQGIARDLSPVIRAADADTTARAATRESEEAAPAEKKGIAFRGVPTKAKQTP